MKKQANPTKIQQLNTDYSSELSAAAAIDVYTRNYIKKEREKLLKIKTRKRQRTNEYQERVQKEKKKSKRLMISFKDITCSYKQLLVCSTITKKNEKRREKKK